MYAYTLYILHALWRVHIITPYVCTLLGQQASAICSDELENDNSMIHGEWGHKNKVIKKKWTNVEPDCLLERINFRVSPLEWRCRGVSIMARRDSLRARHPTEIGDGL